jgi:hypothetical protein
MHLLKLKKIFFIVLGLALLTGIVACNKNFSGSSNIIIAEKDSLLFSFVSIGCNRIDKGDYSAINPSTANTTQLTRTFNDILSLKNTPKFLFFIGDMVLGYTGGDTAKLGSELRAWVNLYEQSGLKKAGIILVPAPGNHETLLDKNQPASRAAEQVFIQVMQPYIQNNNGPVIGGLDNLPVDESQLTYSFNYLNTHFVMMNTDGFARESRLPYKWVANDITTAKVAGAKHIFTFAHKPAYSFPGEDGLSSYPTERDSFWTALEANQSEAMLASHNHLYYRTQPNPTKTWQIISGNGGSSLSSLINSSALMYFGFTLVEVYASGKVMVKSFGRDVPSSGYLGNADLYPTTIRDSVEITWGK